MSLLLIIALIVFIAAYIVLILSLMSRGQESYESFPDAKLALLQSKIAKVIPEAARVKMNGGYKSFTINKKEVYICLKDEKRQYYSDNMLTYVILHELAHVLSKSVNHTPEWEQRFAALLTRAEKGGIYDPTQPIVPNYCEF